MESGPNLHPGLKECVESNGMPNIVATAGAVPSFDAVINGLLFRYKSRKLISSHHQVWPL